MPMIERPNDGVEVEPLSFNIRGIVLTAPGKAPFGTLELLTPAAADPNQSVGQKAGVVPKFLRWVFGEDALAEAARQGLTDDDGLWLFQRLNEVWFGTPTRPSSASSVGDGRTGFASTPSSSPEASTPTEPFHLAAGSPLPSPR